MTAVDDDGAFQETFLLGVTRKGGSEIQFAAICEEITPEEGDKDGEGVVLGNGGRLWKRTPQGDYEVTLKIYPIDLEVGNASDLAQYFMGDISDTTPPISVTNTRTRSLFRLAWLLTTDSSASTAGGSTSSGNNSRRLVFLDARVTGYKESWDDKILSAEVTFKGPAFNKSGTGMITRQSTISADGSGLSALSSYS